MDKANAKVIYEVVPSTLAHAAWIAQYPRIEDEQEVKAASGKGMYEALVLGLELSEKCETWLADGVPVCMFGILKKSALFNVGVPWLLGSTEVAMHEQKFIQHSKRIFFNQAKDYAELENFVDARNTRTIRWLEWLGFTIDAPKPYGVERLPFHRFYMRA